MEFLFSISFISRERGQEVGDGERGKEEEGGGGGEGRGLWED